MQQISWYWRSRLLLSQETEMEWSMLPLFFLDFVLCSFLCLDLRLRLVLCSLVLAFLLDLWWWSSSPGGRRVGGRRKKEGGRGEEEEGGGGEWGGGGGGGGGRGGREGVQWIARRKSLQADESDTLREHIPLTAATFCRGSIFRFLRATGGWPTVRTVTTAAALVVGAATLSPLCLVPDINTNRYATCYNTCARTYHVVRLQSHKSLADSHTSIWLHGLQNIVYNINWHSMNAISYLYT